MNSQNIEKKDVYIRGSKGCFVVVAILALLTTGISPFAFRKWKEHQAYLLQREQWHRQIKSHYDSFCKGMAPESNYSLFRKRLGDYQFDLKDFGLTEQIVSQEMNNLVLLEVEQLATIHSGYLPSHLWERIGWVCKLRSMNVRQFLSDETILTKWMLNWFRAEYYQMNGAGRPDLGTRYRDAQASASKIGYTLAELGMTKEEETKAIQTFLNCWWRNPQEAPRAPYIAFELHMICQLTGIPESNFGVGQEALRRSMNKSYADDYLIHRNFLRQNKIPASLESWMKFSYKHYENRFVDPKEAKSFFDEQFKDCLKQVNQPK